MATNSANEKWAHPEPTQIEEHEDEEDQEEALSLSDLPINNQPAKDQKEEEEAEAEAETPPIKPEEDFDFKSWGGSLLTQPQMCAADDVFFQGQIIPLRHSVSSEAALRRTPPPSRCFSRSESMDRFHSVTGFNSVPNSRSSSLRSLRSSSSGSSTATAATTTTYYQKKHKVLNHFHSHPSPSPQIRITTSRYTNSGNRVPQSRVWNFLRVGLVHTPEIELQGLKNRNGSRNGHKSGFGSRNSNSSSSSSSTSSSGKKKKKKNNKQRLFGNNGFFGGGSCKCSVDAVETMPLRVASIAKEEEVEEKEKEKTTKEKKQTASRHRTFEWLKELSDAGVPD